MAGTCTATASAPGLSTDEATLVYEQVTGNFDKKLRVAYQDGSSTWARAGLIAKEATAFGMDRNTQTTNAAAVRYQKCLVYPVGATLSGPGTPGTASWDLNRRLDVGGLSSGANMTGLNAVPAYPNAWCRLKRVDQTFSMYRSDDGVNWVLLGSTTWGVDDVSKTPCRPPSTSGRITRRRLGMLRSRPTRAHSWPRSAITAIIPPSSIRD